MKAVLELAIQCALESGRIQGESFKKDWHSPQGRDQYCNRCRHCLSERIIELIEKSYPDDYIIAEEKDNVFDEKRNKWIVDPLDGTTNYAHGYPFFCTSIAYEVKGEVVAGVIYNPIFNELFFSQKGHGAYFNGEKIHVSSINDMKQALLSTGFPYDLPTSKKNNINHFINFLYHAQAVRRDGSAAMNLAYIACGRFDGHWEMKLNPWDMAAGALLVKEAGGTITDFKGENFSIYGDELVASNGLLHDRLIEVLKEGA